MKHWCAMGMCVVLAAVVTGCSTNPATGKAQFNVMSESQEITLGAEAAPEFIKSYGGEIPSPEIRQYVSDLGHTLAARSERPDLPWEFFALDSAVINAFALPGGKVFMSRALMEKMTSEAELAGVLGHEIGHVTAQHIGQRMSQAYVVQAAAVGLGVAGAATDQEWMAILGVGTQLGGSFYLLKFGRDQESQSDELGVRYMTKAGYSPVGQLMVMRVLREASKGGSQMEILSTHPLPDTRIERLKELIKEEYPDYDQPGRYVLNEARYKQQVLDRLAKLPPPKHDGKSQDAEAAAATHEAGQATGVRWMEIEAAAHADEPDARQRMVRQMLTAADQTFDEAATYVVVFVPHAGESSR